MHWFYWNISVLVWVWVAVCTVGLVASALLVLETCFDYRAARTYDDISMLPKIALGNLVQESGRALSLGTFLGIGIYFCIYSHLLPYHDPDAAPTSLSIVISLGIIGAIAIVVGCSIYAYVERRTLIIMAEHWRTYKATIRGKDSITKG